MFLKFHATFTLYIPSIFVHPDTIYFSVQEPITIHLIFFLSSPMAISMLARIHASKTSYVFGLLSVLLLIQNGGAFEFVVGGSNGWAPSGSNALNQWAESKRFQIDDSLGKFNTLKFFLLLCPVRSGKSCIIISFGISSV